MSINYTEQTNLMIQYLENKEQCLDTFMLFRIGDFYECFFDDAIHLSKLLGLHLTQRSNHGGAPMCGIPHAHKDKYVQKIILEGFKVSICEQVEDPSLVSGKSLVKREIIQTITPGTVTSDETLDQNSHNYIVGLSKPYDTFGLAVCDLTTGDFSVTEIIDDVDKLLSEIAAYSPSEIIVDASIKSYRGLLKMIRNAMDPVISYAEDRKDYAEYIDSVIRKVPECPSTSKHTAGMLYSYLNKTQKSSLVYINSLEYYTPNKYMVLDINTRKNLELVESNSGTRVGSLLWSIDETETPMGARLLKSYVNKPCIDKDTILQRQDVVEYLVSNPNIRAEIKAILCEVSDIERLTGKATYNKANARDIVKISSALDYTPTIRTILRSSGVNMLLDLSEKLHDVSDLVINIKNAIVNQPPVTIKEGGVIRDGYNEKLDSYRRIKLSATDWVASYQTKLQQTTNIKKLKIVFNQGLGFYIEIPRSSENMMPKDMFERTQQLTTSSRYKTKELSEKQHQINEADANMSDLEYSLFAAIREQVVSSASIIKDIAHVLATIDVLQSFAETSAKHKYVKPVISDDRRELIIRDGRHPVIEQGLLKIEYIANDSDFNKDMQIMMITGPNMAGKSTYMRKIAVISLMAHLGCYVPASSCVVPIMDRIFTRIGASDNLYGGDSTFMLEMKDIKTITDEATNRSLVIIDELGRGTSVMDGMSIAQSVIEYLHDNVKCKAMISTHYYSLTELSQKLSRLSNYHMSVKEDDEDIVFLHKLISGIATSSYGIYCAKIAGVKDLITKRASNITSHFEEPSITTIPAPSYAPTPPVAEVVTVNVVPEHIASILSDIEQTDISSMTPVQAMIFLDAIKRKIKV